MAMSNEEPRIPVKVVFRIGENPMRGAITGMIAQRIEDSLVDPVYAIMPYADITNAGWKQADMVRCFIADENGIEEVAVEWTTIMRDTTPATPEQYNGLEDYLTEHGWDITPIDATQVDHATRKMVKKKNPQPDNNLFSDSSQNVEIITEEFEITLDIVNDNVDSQSGIGSDKFKEDWA